MSSACFAVPDTGAFGAAVLDLGPVFFATGVPNERARALALRACSAALAAADLAASALAAAALAFAAEPAPEPLPVLTAFLAAVASFCFAIASLALKVERLAMLEAACLLALAIAAALAPLATIPALTRPPPGTANVAAGRITSLPIRAS